jgi:serine/threonine-protein kinase
MDRERYQRLREVFQAVESLPEQERDDFLARACAGDQALMQEVQELLALEQDANGFLEGPLFAPRSRAAGPATVIDRKYLLTRCLGQGGMGEVYEAVHLGLNKKLAVKLILSDQPLHAWSLAQLRIEGRALGQLNHPNIVAVTDSGVDTEGGSTPYLVTELLEGITLDEHIKRHGPLDLEEALPLLEGIAEGLDEAHSCQILHGDLKPSNVFLVACSEAGFRAKILDFGLARFFSGSPEGDRDRDREERLAVSSPAVAGTIPYMAPELLDASAPTRHSDLFAFAVLIYETLTGMLPFGTTFDEVRSRQRQGCSPPSQARPELPPELDQVILSGLAGDTELRPLSARKLIAALREAYHRAKIRHWRSTERMRRLALAAALALVATFTGWASGHLPWFRHLESSLVDALFAMTPTRAPDPRIILIFLDKQDRTSLRAQGGGKLGKHLDSIFAAGAAGVGVDILLPESWSNLPAYAAPVIRHSDRLVFACSSAADGEIEGIEAVGGLVAEVLGPEKAARPLGFVNLVEDADGRVRKMRALFRDIKGRSVPSFAARGSVTNSRRRASLSSGS